jgi:hypothetical protein
MFEQNKKFWFTKFAGETFRIIVSNARFSEARKNGIFSGGNFDGAGAPTFAENGEFSEILT